MEIRIKVEAVFEDGRIQQHELGAWKRRPEHLNPEAKGLLLEDAHAILSRLQNVAVSARSKRFLKRVGYALAATSRARSTTIAPANWRRCLAWSL